MENNFKYIVYQTINIVNNKIYVGIHKTKDPFKFDGYIGNGVNINYPSTYMNPKYPFQKAVKKYRTSSFKRSILYIFDTELEASNKEQEIISKEFINRPDTYNLALGGLHQWVTLKYNKIYQFDLNGKLVKEWNDIYEVSDFLETWKQSIYSAIRNKSRLYNYYWSFNSSIDVSQFSNPNNNRKVFKYNLDGKCIEIYDTVGEAAKSNNIQPGHVITYVKNGSLINKSFYLSYELQDEYIKKPRLELKNRLIYLYDLEGNYIKEILSKEALKEFKIHSYTTLSNAILNKTTIHQFQLRLDKMDNIDPYLPKNKKKPVLVYTTSGDFVKECESVTSACREFKLDSSTVSKILRGCGKSTKGYTIKYKN